MLMLAAFFTWFAWKTGNKVQAAIRADADARIREADAKGEQAKADASKADERAAQANERAGIANESASKASASAAKANERTTSLEQDNLKLRGQVATLETTAAEAQKEVAKLEIKAADAQRSAVEAQANLEELRNALAPRMLVWTEESQEELRLFKGQKAFIVYSPDDDDAKVLAAQINGFLLDSSERLSKMPRGAAWDILGVKP
ncbi:MAG TPA: hypothetical protein VHU44_09015 [Acidobacteriaceae bacterium]|nr:hypothetical protein [Acidobacteriaceae bacterium]